MLCFVFFFSSRRRHTRWTGDWSSDVCSSDLLRAKGRGCQAIRRRGCPMSVLMTPPRLTVRIGERDHVVGPETAPVTLVEYGDYECPFCGAAHPVVKALQKALGDNLRFAYRHFPLSQIHPHSFQAAEAAEAAGAQDRFWQMHD